MNGATMTEAISPTQAISPIQDVAAVCDGAVSTSPAWHALWTYSNCEQLVHDQLAAKGFDLFLPIVEAWSRRGGVRRLARIPMFGSYLFLRHAMDKASYLEVYKARGLVRILGERWDQLAVVPDSEI